MIFPTRAFALTLSLASATFASACGGKAIDPSPPAPSSTGSSSGSSTGSCTPVTPAQYDTSCTVDGDCVAVGSIDTCPASACDSCELAAINRSEAAAYAAAFQASFTSRAAGDACGCPCSNGAVCRGGVCQAASCVPPPGDTLAACGDAGGQCMYAARTTCGATGPTNACAYSDEICCLN